MKTKNYHFKLSFFILVIILDISIIPTGIFAQDKPNTITFINKSGEFAKIKLIGSTIESVKIPEGQSRTLNVAAGEYNIMVRYGIDSSKYRFFKGDPFKVIQTETEYSIISITLDSFRSGNIPVFPSSKEEFERTLR
jgi:hypothetical protein